jgi:hypothetical protein
MDGDIFVIQGDGRLVELSHRPYDSEDHLQELLAHYPALLAGGQINPESPRRWLLVEREVGVPDETGGSDRWALDHLFLDQDGVPTLVEVKRSTDTRIRREVVGQMLDYAANAVAYWPVESLRARFESRCETEGLDPEATLSEFLGPEGVPENYWERVKTNLLAGRLRLVFVADAVPAELRRVVEFLNQQMDPAEVLAIEVPQFVGADVRTIAPRVIGRTEQASRARGTASGPRAQWTEETFLAALEERTSPQVVAVCRDLLRRGEALGLQTWWGRGLKDGSFTLWLKHGGQNYYLVSAYTYGRIEALFQYLRTAGPFRDLEVREEFRGRLNAVPGFAIPPDALERRPRLALTDLAAAPGALDRLIEALAWARERIEAREGLPPGSGGA